MLAWLMAGHLVGDFLLQNKWMSENKEKNIVPLLTHSAFYSAAVWLFSFGSGGLDWKSVSLIFVTHIILDNRKFVRWWSKNVTRSFPSKTLVMMIDQTWHVVALVLACLLDSFLKGAL